MHIPHLISAVLIPVFLLAHAGAHAHESIYSAPLLGASETPAANTPGIGVATVTVDFDLVTLRVEASFSDLLGNVTAAHIHCCTAEPLAGNVGVASQTPSFTGFPLGVTAGTYDHTFDLSLASSYNAGFITANGGTVSGAFNALVTGLNAGKAYFNVHTSAFPGGEVRALLTPVPEPESYALVASGLAILAAAAMRRRRGGQALEKRV
jgi:hypothetical protein